jgi:hypothetical protein
LLAAGFSPKDAVQIVNSDYFRKVSEKDRAAAFAVFAGTKTMGFEEAAKLAVKADPRFADGFKAQFAKDDEFSLGRALSSVSRAMDSGKTPKEAGLDEGLFPPGYVELGNLDVKEATLSGSYDHADGWGLLPDKIDPFSDNSDRKDVGRELEAVRKRQAEVRKTLGFEGVEMTSGGIAKSMIDYTGQKEWAVKQFAKDLKEHSRGAGLGQISSYIANDKEMAVAFYNELGPDEARKLVSVPSASREVLTDYSVGLGKAAGSAHLNFTGAEFVDVDIINSSPSPWQLVALAEDSFPTGFLVDAAAQTFKLQEEYRDYTITGTELIWFEMGSGPYTDLPDGADLKAGPSVGKYRGQTESGYFGKPTDSPALVALNVVGDRGTAATVALMNELGEEDRDALMRFEPYKGTYPTNWIKDDRNRTTSILADAATPEPEGYYENILEPEEHKLSGRQLKQSDVASLWLIKGAANPSQGGELKMSGPVAVAVEETFALHLTTLVQAPADKESQKQMRQRLLAGQMVRQPIDSELDLETVQRAVEATYRSGEGGTLTALKGSLLGETIISKVKEGNTRPEDEDFPRFYWVGDVEGTIDNGMKRAGIGIAAGIDKRNKNKQRVGGLIINGIVAARFAGSPVPPVEQYVIGEGVGQVGGSVLDHYLPDDHEKELWKELEATENKEPLDHRRQLLDAMIRLDLLLDVEAPTEREKRKAFVKNLVSDLTEFDQLKLKLKDSDGKPQTLRDWMVLSTEAEGANALQENEYNMRD